MKKTTITLALIAAGLVATPVMAQETKPKNWVGGYGMYYSTDAGKPQPAAQIDDGFGIGAEAGFRFDENWAARISASYLDLDGANGGNGESGPLLGVDAMYFFLDDMFYVFGGLYYENLDDNYQMLGYGMGKQWAVSDKFKLITELAAYRDFSESYYDVSAKLGLSYTFGASTQSTYNAPAPAVAAPADSDKDGVIDSMDQCPNTPVGDKVDAKGCTLEPDSDNDGVADSKDECPDTPEGDEVHPNGCTVFTEEKVSIAIRVMFANNSSVVENKADPQIVELAQFLTRYGKTKAVIEGHTSAPGSEEYNKDLSLRRANAIKAVLVNDYGIDMTRLGTVGYGEERLLDTGVTKEANRKNRRIEVNISENITLPKPRKK